MNKVTPEQFLSAEYQLMTYGYMLKGTEILQKWDELKESEFQTTNDLVDKVIKDVETLIGYAKADLEHARENDAKDDFAETNTRLIHLGGAYNLLKGAYKEV